MRITRETLIRVAKETAQKRATSDPGLVAAYLIGSLLNNDPFLGNTTDVDIVFVHAEKPPVRREFVPLTPDVHLDICHRSRSEYDKPKELRVHPWLGPELYNPLPLYVTQHFLEFVQAGVRTKYHEPANILERSRRNAQHARDMWIGVQTNPDPSPEGLLQYLKTINYAANAVAILNGAPLSERHFLLQFPARSEAAGRPDLAAGLLGLLGASHVDAAILSGFLTDWENAFMDAASRSQSPEGIALPRLAYYKQAFEHLLAGDSPQAVLWPLILTWTLSVASLPIYRQARWQEACGSLGLSGDAYTERVDGLDRFLDSIEELLENMADSQGL